MADRAEKPTKSELYRRAEALVPALSERAPHCEAIRQCPPETIAALADAGLLEICKPARYGGWEYGWDTLSEVNRILAHGCASQAWVANVLNDHTQLVGAFLPEAQDEVWGRHPGARIAASVAPSGKARLAKGGAVIAGTFGFASGIDYADWLICGGMLARGDGPPAWYDFLVPIASARIVDDWHVAGLAGTGSKSFQLDDVFVPPHRFQDHVHSDDGTGPGTQHNRAAVFRTPRASVAALGFSALAVGIAEAFLETYIGHTQHRKGRGLPENEFGSTQLGLAEATARIEGAAAYQRSVLDIWVRLLETGGALDTHEKLKARFQAATIARQCLQSVEALFAAAGGHAIFTANPLQRQLRDLIAVATHRGLYLDESAPLYGKSILARGRT